MKYWSRWAGLYCLACGTSSAPPAPSAGAEPAPAETQGSPIPGSAPGSAAPAEAPATGAPVVEAPGVVPLGTAALPELPDDAPTLVVSLTFDDTFEPQVDAAARLEAHGLRGTFYVNSPRLHDGSANPDGSVYMSRAEALDLQARGHEMGGHTLSHLGLTSLPEAERVREIMGDRAQLLSLGIEARSFAYPSGDAENETDATLGRPVLSIARGSGYSSARDTNGFGLNGCNAAPESIPPRDAFLLRSVRSVNDNPPVASGQPPLPPDTAATLLGWMDHAVSCGGDWLPLVFHHLRADCSVPDAPGSFCFNLAELELLASALAVGARCPEDGSAPCYRISVLPVSAALGATELLPAPEVFALRNPSLERALASGSTECIQDTQGSQGTATFARSTSLARSGVASERLEIAAPFVAPAEIRIVRDFGACSPFASAGRAYALSLHYRAEPAPVPPTLRFVTYRLTSDYTWEPWATSEPFVAATPGEWVRESFTTEPVPADTIAFSFGVRQESVGAINVDDFEGVALGLDGVPLSSDGSDDAGSPASSRADGG
jgi:peptidoglycan/xylan/chitin deacetylase (PgdA/CDA1 family)